jgi:hypothetical protein
MGRTGAQRWKRPGPHEIHAERGPAMLAWPGLK